MNLMKIYTAIEIAKIMGVSPQYVRRLCAQGKLEAQRLGRHWVIYSPVVKGK